MRLAEIKNPWQSYPRRLRRRDPRHWRALSNAALTGAPARFHAKLAGQPSPAGYRRSAGDRGQARPFKGMSRPLLKLGGGSGEILRDVHL